MNTHSTDTDPPNKVLSGASKSNRFGIESGQGTQIGALKSTWKKLNLSTA